MKVDGKKQKERLSDERMRWEEIKIRWEKGVSICIAKEISAPVTWRHGPPELGSTAGCHPNVVRSAFQEVLEQHGLGHDPYFKLVEADQDLVRLALFGK